MCLCGQLLLHGEQGGALPALGSRCHAVGSWALQMPLWQRQGANCNETNVTLLGALTPNFSSGLS